MLTKLRKRHGAALPIAVIALIVAVAFAGVPAIAAPVANTSASLVKKVAIALKLSRVANKRSIQAIKIARNAAGTPGPQGPAGPAGPAGPKGDKGDKGDDGSNGSNGTDGSDGTDGKSVQTGNATLAECPEGGATVQVEGEDATKKKVCNGADGDEGSPWTELGTLPEGATLKGSWVVRDPEIPPASAKYQAALSFSVPLAAELDSAHVKAHLPGYDGTGEATPAEENCPGTANDPRAKSGHLCVYASTMKGTIGFSGSLLAPTIAQPAGGGNGADIAGALVTVSAPTAFGEGPTEPLEAFGSWAVTG